MDPCARHANGEPRKKRVYTPLSSLAMHKQHPSLQRHEGGDEAENERPDVEEDAPSPTIHNIVSTSKIVCIPSSLPFPTATDAATNAAPAAPVAINLDHIYEVVQCSHYNRRKFAAITIRIDDPTVTALLFTSGR